MTVDTKTVFTANDGAMFLTEDECSNHERNCNRNEVEKILRLMHELKHGDGTLDRKTLGQLQQKAHDARVAFLKACKGKRRYTSRFAQEIMARADDYIVARRNYLATLETFDNLRRQLKAIDPRFIRENKRKRKEVVV